MITDGRASLVIRSAMTTAAQITAALGIEPTEAHEIGDPTWAALAGRPVSPERMSHQHALWKIDGPEEDGDGPFASLRGLLRLLESRAEALEQLRSSCDTNIWWYGSSDSEQGGFVMAPDLLKALAESGCALYGTAYLDGGSGTEESWSRDVQRPS